MDINKVTIQAETPDDYSAVEHLTRLAFWNLYRPGCEEHFIVNKMRQSSDFVKELDFVAVYDNQLIGNIMYTLARVVDDNGTSCDVLCLGPVSVLPEFQKMGVGNLLIRFTLDLARQLNYPGVILFGNPGYYSRFGFTEAKHFEITTSDGENFDAFMALELKIKSLSGIKGKFYATEAFNVDKDELEKFDKLFPVMEKKVTESQIFS